MRLKFQPSQAVHHLSQCKRWLRHHWQQKMLLFLGIQHRFYAAQLISDCLCKMTKLQHWPHQTAFIPLRQTTAQMCISACVSLLVMWRAAASMYVCKFTSCSSTYRGGWENPTYWRMVWGPSGRCSMKHSLKICTYMTVFEGLIFMSYARTYGLS